MAQQHDDRFNPPPVILPEVAKVSVGFSQKGHLAVRVLLTSSAELLPGLKETFDRAAAAFMQEFARNETLMATVRGVDCGELKATEQTTIETAQRDNAVRVGFDTDVS